MNRVRVRLLTFEGCPLADAARSVLRQALAECGITDYEEIDLLDPATDVELQGWGSPTILVNGKDVTGKSSGDAIGCRVYRGQDRVPDRGTISAVVRAEIAAQRG
ncbi:MAG: hypothetical protein WD795_04715 [Woeseia sp.]